ncbi:hypothetical protein BJX64DRAFT_295520 [Aspergillus heterothallicus]
MPHRLQFYKNTLPLPEITKSSLQDIIAELQAAVVNGVQLIESAHPAGEDDGRGMFSGDIGIALAYLRLAHQARGFDTTEDSMLPPFRDLAHARIPRGPSTEDLAIGQLSPLASKSPLSSATLRILHHVSERSAGCILDTDFTVLRDAVELALSHGATGFYHGHELGADEVLFGRAGLLWTVLNIQKWTLFFEERQLGLLGGVLEEETVGKLVEAIVRAGQEGGAECRRILGESETKQGEVAKPLLWVWMKGHYGLGWAHGLTGIISVLLSAPPRLITPHLPSIAETISLLCKTCINEDGHLPTCIPPRSTSSSRTSPLVQLCHGSPAFLAFMACALRVPSLIKNHWTREGDTAIRHATDRVWNEGLLAKGGGLCHGIAGNAWPLLMLYSSSEENRVVLEEARSKYDTPPDTKLNAPLEPDFFLSRALAMLLHARETQPYCQTPDQTDHAYRMPDHPYSLFEGLSGTLCAWAEACSVLRHKLRILELQAEGQVVDVNHDSVLHEVKMAQLGFPFLGGNGVTGII